MKPELRQLLRSFQSLERIIPLEDGSTSYIPEEIYKYFETLSASELLAYVVDPNKQVRVAAKHRLKYLRERNSVNAKDGNDQAS